MKKERKSKAGQKTHVAVVVSCLSRSNNVCTKGGAGRFNFCLPLSVVIPDV